MCADGFTLYYSGGDDDVVFDLAADFDETHFIFKFSFIDGVVFFDG